MICACVCSDCTTMCNLNFGRWMKMVLKKGLSQRRSIAGKKVVGPNSWRWFLNCPTPYCLIALISQNCWAKTWFLHVFPAFNSPSTCFQSIPLARSVLGSGRGGSRSVSHPKGRSGDGLEVPKRSTAYRYILYHFICICLTATAINVIDFSYIYIYIAVN